VLDPLLVALAFDPLLPALAYPPSSIFVLAVCVGVNALDVAVEHMPAVAWTANPFRGLDFDADNLCER